MERRAFVAALGGATLGGLPAGVPHAVEVVLSRLRAAGRSVAGRSAIAVADDEGYWRRVRQAFALDTNHVNLNSGSVSPAPRVVADAMQRYWTITNMAPSLYVDDLLGPQVEQVRRHLARVIACDAEQLALVRNTSEGMHIAQMGLPLQRGDEVVTTTQDYPRMLWAWDTRARREGIVVKRVAFPTPPPSLDALADRVLAAVTPRTRVIMVSHMTYTTGQIFPVRRIADAARARGIVTMVDGGHTFAHFPFTFDELGCDVYASSLHKWLCAPVGNGVLVMRPEMIARTWPLMPVPASLDGNIRKFEQIGTHPLALRAAVSDAVTFHEEIGGERKAARLRFLRERWMDGVASVPGVRLLTGRDPAQAVALGALQLEGLGAEALVQALQRRWGIHVRPRFVDGEFECIRVTPNVFTTLDEIDQFVTAIRTLATERR